jgi:hypothetical protein
MKMAWLMVFAMKVVDIEDMVSFDLAYMISGT